MRNLRDPKVMAKTLRAVLAQRNIVTSHSECLEIVAQQFGLPDWNTLSAKSVEDGIAPLPNLVLPNGWHVSGTQLQDYHIGINPDVLGSPATIRTTKPRKSKDAFATLMQSIKADRYRDERVQLTAELRCVDTDGYVTIWMRIDDAHRKVLRFDNLERRKDTRPLTGFTDWSKRSIVLDVPDDAESIHYGFFLKGNGQVSARSFDLKRVGEDMDITSDCGAWLKEPTNLNFAEDSIREIAD